MDVEIPYQIVNGGLYYKICSSIYIDNDGCNLGQYSLEILFVFYWTKIYPYVLMSFSPLSAFSGALFPHEILLFGFPAVPNPILESQDAQLFWLFPIIPILAWECFAQVQAALNPSLLQPLCSEASEPINDLHVLRPSEVARYLPSAISE